MCNGDLIVSVNSLNLVRFQNCDVGFMKSDYPLQSISDSSLLILVMEIM